MNKIIFSLFAFSLFLRCSVTKSTQENHINSNKFDSSKLDQYFEISSERDEEFFASNEQCLDSLLVSSKS